MAGRPRQFDDQAAVDAAVGIFWRKGYAATTPQELADELSIGKGSLYNTFKSKANLLSLALRRYSDHKLQALENELEADGPVRDRMRSALAMLAGIGVHSRGCFAVNSVVELAGTGSEATTVPQQLFDRIEQAFKDAIVRGQRSGELSADVDPSSEASLLLSAVMGASVLARSGADAERLQRVLAGAVASL
jgi:TetR/AcrR family transcriptional repressor of nem operon